MKDIEARGRIKNLERWQGIHMDKTYGNLQRTSIQDCPKCRHPVMVKEHVGNYTSTLSLYSADPSYYQCLSCGVKFTCSTEKVCKVIDA